MALTPLEMDSAHAQNYSYGDGSANRYRITPGELSYPPVTKETSSSGVYSGGAAQRVRLADAEFRGLRQLLDEAIADTRAHTDIAGEDER